jgi:hypothetical protein
MDYLVRTQAGNGEVRIQQIYSEDVVCRGDHIGLVSRVHGESETEPEEDSDLEDEDDDNEVRTPISTAPILRLCYFRTA